MWCGLWKLVRWKLISSSPKQCAPLNAGPATECLAPLTIE